MWCMLVNVTLEWMMSRPIIGKSLGYYEWKQWRSQSILFSNGYPRDEEAPKIIIIFLYFGLILVTQGHYPRLMLLLVIHKSILYIQNVNRKHTSFFSVSYLPLLKSFPPPFYICIHSWKKLAKYTSIWQN
jgi:hypothetical protein